MLKSWFNYKLIDIQETFVWFLWGALNVIVNNIIIVLNKMKQFIGDDFFLYKKIRKSKSNNNSL